VSLEEVGGMSRTGRKVSPLIVADISLSLFRELTFGGGGPGLRPSALLASSSNRLVELELDMESD
jgi:hypothetical protein